MMNVNVLFIIVGALCTCGVSVPEAESDLHVKLAELSANITKIKVMIEEQIATWPISVSSAGEIFLRPAYTTKVSGTCFWNSNTKQLGDLFQDQRKSGTCVQLSSISGPRFFSFWYTLDVPSTPSAVHAFYIEGTCMLTVTSYSHGTVYIYAASNGQFYNVQNISILHAVATKDLILHGEHYLVVAVNDNPYSRVYKWNGMNFTASGSIDATYATGVDAIMSTEHGSFLALKTLSITARNTIATFTSIYKIVPSVGKLVRVTLHQKLEGTAGTSKMHFFTTDSKLYLSIARSCDDCPSGSQSLVYEYVNNQFVLFQSFPKGQDLYPFTSGCNLFLVAAGVQEGAYNGTSVIYRYDKFKRLFEKFQVIDDPNASTVEHLVIHHEHFLLLSGYVSAISSNVTGRLYRMDGTSVSMFQQIDFTSDVKLHPFFKLEDEYVLIAASSDDLALHRWNSLTDSCNAMPKNILN